MNAISAREEQLLKPTLKAAIIYDDFEFAARTALQLEQAAVRSDEAMRWDIRPWRLDLLKSSSLAEAALAEAADADLIVIALSRTPLVPDALLGWLDRWADGRRVREAALLVLCPEAAAGPKSSWERLKAFAAWRGLSFLDDRRRADGQDTLDRVHRWWPDRGQVNPALSWTADPPQSPRHWGINE